jgi:3-methyladenine DNA glycosylase/8-oxoguanine DNA glycosylase
VQALGVPWPDDPSRRSFPTPDAILAAGERFFREEVRLGYRVRAVLELAERAEELERLKEEPLPTVELRRRLLNYRGVGPYGAATVLTLLGRYDDLAIDSEMRAFAARRYFGGRKPTDAEVRALYASWGCWKSLGYWLDSLD